MLPVTRSQSQHRSENAVKLYLTKIPQFIESYPGSLFKEGTLYSVMDLVANLFSMAKSLKMNVPDCH